LQVTCYYEKCIKGSNIRSKKLLTHQDPCRPYGQPDMQTEVETKQSTRNYLAQGGLPVTHRNCSEYHLGEKLFWAGCFLCLPLLTGWPGRPGTTLAVYLIELLPFFVVPGTLWLITRRTWLAFALCMKNNLTILVVVFPLFISGIVIGKIKDHSIYLNSRAWSWQQHPHPLSLHPHLTQLWGLDFFGFCFAQYALRYFLRKKIMSSFGLAKERAQLIFMVGIVLLGYGMVAWAFLYLHLFGYL